MRLSASEGQDYLGQTQSQAQGEHLGNLCCMRGGVDVCRKGRGLASHSPVPGDHFQTFEVGQGEEEERGDFYPRVFGLSQ